MFGTVSRALQAFVLLHELSTLQTSHQTPSAYSSFKPPPSASPDGVFLHGRFGRSEPGVELGLGSGATAGW